MNKRMDNKLIEEKITNSSVGFISEQGEKKTFLNLLEKQRMIEEQLKYGGTKNFILEQEVEVENEDLSDMPNLETEEDYNEMINLYPEEFQEFLELLAKKVESSSETNQPGDLNESTLDYGKINIKDIRIIKTHGTGTVSNNKAEKNALNNTLSNFVATSYKQKIGHTMGTSGLLETLLLLDDIKYGIIPCIENRTEVDNIFLSTPISAPEGLIMSLSAGMGNVYSAAIFKNLQ